MGSKVRLPHLAFLDAVKTGQWNARRLRIVQAGEPVLRAQAGLLPREKIIPTPGFIGALLNKAHSG
jgi:hypothetical protein